MNSEQLQNHLGILRQRFKLIIRIFRQRILNQLDLFELMLTNYATRILPVTAGFRSKTRRVRRPLHRQLSGVKNFFAMIIRDWNFRGRHEIEAAFVFQLEKILLEFRQLTCAEKRVSIDDERWQRFQVTMLA